MRTLLRQCWNVNLEQPLWRQCECVLSHLSRIQLFLTLWTVTFQAPLSLGFSRQELEWVAMPSSGESSPPRDQTCISCFLHRQVGSLPLTPPGKPMETVWRFLKQWKWEQNYNIPVNLKNIHNLKVELCFIRWELTGLQAQETPSQVTLRDLLPGGEGRSQVTRNFVTQSR